jgi:hypothetical protein
LQCQSSKDIFNNKDLVVFLLGYLYVHVCTRNGIKPRNVHVQIIENKVQKNTKNNFYQGEIKS